MYLAILLCTNACMYKRINKNCATFLIKKRDKNHLYYILSYFELYLSALLFFFYNKKGNYDYIIIYLLTLYSAMLMFFVAYGKLCVSVICVLVFDLLYKPGTSERAILLCTLYPDPSFSVLRLTRVSV